MSVPSCPEHGDLMREFACGRVDDEQSMRAESMREKCAHCARWWRETLSGDCYGVVDAAVAEAIARYAPPVNRRYRRLAAAAAVVLAIGVGATSPFWRGGPNAPADDIDVVSTWDFEAGTLKESIVTGTDAPGGGEEVSVEPTVFASDLESGDLSSWSSHS